MTEPQVLPLAAEYPVSEEMLDSMRKGSQVAVEGELRMRSGQLEVRVKAIRDLGRPAK